MFVDDPHAPARRALRNRIREDLVGPSLGQDEVLRDRPSDVYLTGILWPRGAMANPEDDDSREVDDRGAEGEGSGTGAQVSMRSMHKPHSMGLSFRVRAGHQLHIRVRGARYEVRNNTNPEEEIGPLTPREDEEWVRRPFEFVHAPKLADGHVRDVEIGEDLLLHVWTRPSTEDNVREVTIVVMNGRSRVRGELSRLQAERDMVFQASVQVTLEAGSFAARPLASASHDEDGRIHRLVYRARQSFATGHTCSASWHPLEKPTLIEAEWLPEVLVPSVDARGHRAFEETAQTAGFELESAFGAAELGAADRLGDRLSVVADAWAGWLDIIRGASDPHAESDEEMKATLENNLAIADRMLARMRRGIALVTEDGDMADAFRLAMRAMDIQARWGSRLERGSEQPLIWRPFQLAFQLLCIPAFSDRDDDLDRLSRDVMDLLWFPTGGGKTEAYLGLIAFVLILRRLRGEAIDVTSILMRYTLRTLTNQQFERASRLIMALEELRRADHRLGARRFLIGLWVGQSGSPNHVRASREENNSKAQVLRCCPACGGPLAWDPDWVAAGSPDPEDSRTIPWHVDCTRDECPVQGALPIHVIDETLYGEPPDLLIGTIDKFAQVVRKAETHPLVVGLDLVIQDELHLITGPLGSIDGLYEAALDIITSSHRARPKIIGSTATIRRAHDQVVQLYDREVAQFPPPVRDWEDSCFSRLDVHSPGRIYLGITSCGRSPKFALQAVFASLLQGKHELSLSGGHAASDLDPFHTVVGYFNSRRELGGATILARDDTPRTIAQLAERRGMDARELDIEGPVEVTGRLSSDDIPRIIERLKRGQDDEEAVDIALATNMISVGVDIPRLGVMVVAGQPKGMSEYIQATSRVGRGRIPGLVVTLYNDAKARDRSHYESHVAWLLAPYREVEANSVTPWSPRARERALRAVVVAIARHGVAGMLEQPALTTQARQGVEAAVQPLLQRVARVESRERRALRREVNTFLDHWANRWRATNGDLRYWWERRPSNSLLVSLEWVAVRAALGQARGDVVPAPNSMRNVEPEVRFRMARGLGR